MISSVLSGPQADTPAGRLRLLPPSSGHLVHEQREDLYLWKRDDGAYDVYGSVE